MPVECFWLDPTDRVRLSLRRYRSGEVCSALFGYHNAMVPIGQAPILWSDGRRTYQAPPVAEYENDPRWPAFCSCGEPFRETDTWQVTTDRIYVRADNGTELILGEAQPGAMYDAEWYPWKGVDGRSLVVICPDKHPWSIDGRASNCTEPNDNEHRCWLRTGEPPKITVSKSAPGQRSCSAGGGSIGTPGYHGFLVDGRFT